MKQPWAQESYDPEPLMELPPELIDEPPALVPVESNGQRSPAFDRWVSSNVRPQKQEGYNVVTVKLPLGDISTEQFPILSRIARDFAGGRIRTTVEQNVVYRWVPTGVVKEVWRQLKDAGLGKQEPERSRMSSPAPAPTAASSALHLQWVWVRPSAMPLERRPMRTR